MIYTFCCRLQISLTVAKLSFPERREQSTCMQLQQKDQNHIAASPCCQVHSHVRATGAVSLQILDSNY